MALPVRHFLRHIFRPTVHHPINIRGILFGMLPIALAFPEAAAQPSPASSTRVEAVRAVTATNPERLRAVRVPGGISIDTRTLNARGVWLHGAGADSAKAVRDSTLTVKPGQVAILQTGTALIRQEILGRRNTAVSGFAMPFRIISVDRQGSPHNLEACIETGNGMSLQDSVPGYAGKIWIAIQDTEQRQAGYDLPASIGVILTGFGLQIAPGKIEFSKANDYQSFTVSSRNPPDPATVRARLTGLSGDLASQTPVIEVAVPVLRPQLAVKISSLAVAGFGLDEAMVTVQATGYANPSGLEVALNARGHLSDAVVKLNPQGFAGTKIRSAGIGTDTVNASTAEASGASPGFRYLFPWSFFISTLLGSLMGAAIERMQSKRPRGTWTRRLLLGVLVGFAFTVLFAVGVANVQWITPTAKTGEAVILALALAGAFGGFRLFNPSGK